MKTSRLLGLATVLGLLGLCWAALVTVRSPASSGESDQRIAAVLTQQQTYLQSITSLQFDARSVVEYGEALQAAGVPAARIENALRFATSGARFRAESTYGNPAIPRTKTLTVAFDGEKYQTLDMLSTTTLSVTRSRAKDKPYPGMHPLVLIYGWALRPGHEHSLAQLQYGDVWSQLSADVVSCTEVTKTGISAIENSGIELKLTSPPAGSSADQTTYEVIFASEFDYLPVYCKTVLPDGFTLESQVTATETVPSNIGPIRIPRRVEWVSRLSDGRLSDAGCLEIDTSTLKVNKPIDDGVFTIPLSSADRFIDEDIGVTIRQ